jgi:hypothetical protein
VKRAEGAVTLPLGAPERFLLTVLVHELKALVAAPEPSDDPIQAWENELNARPIDHNDPVVGRLFPSAYHRADLDAEYRRLTETGLRAGKDQDAAVVLADLNAAEGADVTVAADHVVAWLRTVNALRLVFAVRLGVETAADADELDDIGPDDPRANAVQMYHWLAYLQAVLLDGAP